MTFAVRLPRESYSLAKPADFTVASAFDLRTAGAMAWLSQLAYETHDKEDEGKVSDVLREWQLIRAAPLKSPETGSSLQVDTDGLIVTSRNATIVAFAGTDPLVVEDWLTDLDARPSKDNIHSGFQAGVESVWSQITSAIGKSAAAQTPIVVTGHSLGGALAVVAAKFLRERLQLQVDAVYTFGMPRCLGSAIVDDYERSLGATTYRLVHGRDIVPTLPPSAFDFRHVGRLLQCPQDDQFDAAFLSDARCDKPDFLDLDFLDLLDEAVRAGLSPLDVAKILRKIGRIVEIIKGRGRSTPSQPGLLGKVISLLPSPIRHHVPSQYLRALGFNVAVQNID